MEQNKSLGLLSLARKGGNIVLGGEIYSYTAIMEWNPFSTRWLQ